MSAMDNAICGFIDEEDDVEANEEPTFDDGEFESGCCFPGECCVPGPHMRAECHTAEMLEAIYAEAAHI
jgi:hypothetical protein